MTSPASRKSAERQRRKDAGEVRVEVWLTADEAARINRVGSLLNMSPAETVRYAVNLI